jgi:shikimate kinase
MSQVIFCNDKKNVYMGPSLLNSEQIVLTKPIALIGMMGVGKTHIGRLLAKELGISFVDSDDEIVLSAGQAVCDIFEFYGESAFRDLEGKVIERLLENKASVISTGGGCITQPETLEKLKLSSHLIWLTSDIDVLVERTARRDDRPLLKGRDPHEALSSLFAARKPLYAQAAFSVDSGAGARDVVQKIIDYLAE